MGLCFEVVTGWCKDGVCRGVWGGRVWEGSGGCLGMYGGVRGMLQGMWVGTGGCLRCLEGVWWGSGGYLRGGLFQHMLEIL